MIPLFSKTWWKWTAINCVMFQAQVTWDDHIHHGLEREILRDSRTTKVQDTRTWYPVDNQKQWQERSKLIGTR